MLGPGEDDALPVLQAGSKCATAEGRRLDDLESLADSEPAWGDSFVGALPMVNVSERRFKKKKKESRNQNKLEKKTQTYRYVESRELWDYTNVNDLTAVKKFVWKLSLE